jgi:hypothetical protein
MLLVNYPKTIIGGYMFKRYILIFVIALCMIPLSFAQKMEKTGGYARILGMGNNPYIMDPFYVTVNPAWGAYYDHFLFGDLGSTAGAFAAGGVGQFAAVNFRINPDFTIGALLTRNDFNGFGISRLDPPLFNSATVSALPGSLIGLVNANLPAGYNNAIGLNNNLELYGTLKFGNTAVGLGVAYASTKNETSPGGTTGTTSTSASQIGFNLGVISDFTSSMKLDLGASLMLPSVSAEAPSPAVNLKASRTIIAAAARLFWSYSSKLSLVPTVNFIMASSSVDIPSGTTSKTEDLPSNMIILAGFGINYKVGDFLLAGGPSFIYQKASQDSNAFDNTRSVTRMIFPMWNLGVEWKMTDWFVARLGYIASTGSQKGEHTHNGVTSEGITTIFLPAPGATVGVGFRLGSFSLDATVNEDVLRQGLANIGGVGATFAYLSASYALP